MSVIYTWIGAQPKVKTFRTRNEALKQCPLGGYPVRIKFRFEIVWCINYENHLMCENGEYPFVAVENIAGKGDQYASDLNMDNPIHEKYIRSLIDREKLLCNTNH